MHAQFVNSRLMNLFFQFVSSIKKIFLASREFLFSFLFHLFFLFLVFLGIETKQEAFKEPVYKIELSTLSFPAKKNSGETSVEMEVEKIEKTILKTSQVKAKPTETVKTVKTAKTAKPVKTVKTVKTVEVTAPKKVDEVKTVETGVLEAETIKIGKVEDKNNDVDFSKNEDVLNEKLQKIKVPIVRTLDEEIADLQSIANQTAFERDIKEEKNSTEFLEQELESMRTLANNSQKAKTQPSAEGLLEIYRDIVEEEVKKHWRYSFFSKDDNLRVIIEITIDSNGKIVDPILIMSSGKFEFDNSAFRAIEKVGVLPEPPINTLRKIVINFNLDELK